jgi:hypothetical protein
MITLTPVFSRGTVRVDMVKDPLILPDMQHGPRIHFTSADKNLADDEIIATCRYPSPQRGRQIVAWRRERQVHFSVRRPSGWPLKLRPVVAICLAAERAGPSVEPLSRLSQPALGNLTVGARRHVQVIIHQRKATARHREDLRKFLQPAIDPFFAVEFPFPQEKGTADTAGHTVIPASQRNVDEVGARDCRGGISRCDRR